LQQRSKEGIDLLKTRLALCALAIRPVSTFAVAQQVSVNCNRNNTDPARNLSEPVTFASCPAFA
jgi:hypothetical protein